MKKCGSKTLVKEGNDVICKECGYRIKDYKKLALELGRVEFKKFEQRIE